MTISLIWAMSDDRVIGINNQLPWKLPVDMRWFRKNTLGKPIIMGRKTYESFGAKALPERTNIIVTTSPTFKAADAIITHSLEAALNAAGTAEETMIIGGASLYEQTLPKAQKLYMTQVHTTISGDTWFPNIDITQWRECESQDHPADDKNPYSCTFKMLERLPSANATVV